MKVFTTIVAIFFSFIMLEFLTRVMIDDGLNYEIEMLKYANKLTLSIQNMEKNDVEKLRVIGIIDGEILEVNQVVAYFNYSNRLLNGLGVSTSGDVVGFYSGSDEC